MATRVRSASSQAKDTARSRQWASENREHINAARRASRAAVSRQTPRSDAYEAQAAREAANALEYEEAIRRVVVAAVEAGTLRSGSTWYGQTADQVRDAPLPQAGQSRSHPGWSRPKVSTLASDAAAKAAATRTSTGRLQTSLPDTSPARTPVR